MDRLSSTKHLREIYHFRPNFKYAAFGGQPLTLIYKIPALQYYIPLRYRWKHWTKQPCLSTTLRRHIEKYHLFPGLCVFAVLAPLRLGSRGKLGSRLTHVKLGELRGSQGQEGTKRSSRFCLFTCISLTVCPPNFALPGKNDWYMMIACAWNSELQLYFFRKTSIRCIWMTGTSGTYM